MVKGHLFWFPASVIKTNPVQAASGVDVSISWLLMTCVWQTVVDDVSHLSPCLYFAFPTEDYCVDIAYAEVHLGCWFSANYVKSDFNGLRQEGVIVTRTLVRFWGFIFVLYRNFIWRWYFNYSRRMVHISHWFCVFHAIKLNGDG